MYFGHSEDAQTLEDALAALREAMLFGLHSLLQSACSKCIALRVQKTKHRVSMACVAGFVMMVLGIQLEFWHLDPC